MLQGYWSNEFGDIAPAGPYQDKSYWICTENWPGQNFPIDLDVYYNTGGFSNGYVPLFIVVGFNNVVYYDDNSEAPVQQAVRDAIDSFPTAGVVVAAPVTDKTVIPSQVLNIDVSNVFIDFEGDPLTITLVSNSDPSKATANLAGNTLTVTVSSTEYVGSTSIVIKGEDVAHGESAQDEFVVNIVGNEWDGASITPLNVDIVIPADQTDTDIVSIVSGIPAVLNFTGSINFISKKSTPVNRSIVVDPNLDRSKLESHDTGITFEKATTPKAQWDQQFAYDVTTLSGGVGAQAGCESDGNFIYTTVWSSADILKFGMDGTYIETFTIPTVTGLRDLAYDGEFFYGGAAGTTIWIMDFAGKRLEGTITSPTAVRAIAYDDASDGFWVNNWDTDMVLVGRDGSTIDTITNIPSCYGAAYDNFSAGGPYLWVNTGTAAGSPATVEKFDIAAHATTGFTFQAAVTEIAGGCFIQEDIVFGTATIGVMAQGERVYGYELCSTETWLTLSNASGAIPVSGNHDVTLNFDAAGLTLGTVKTATLVFKDENNFEYANPVNVTMTIGAATTPDITLSVATINTTAAPEAIDTDSFDMGNVGDGDLDYNITTAYTSKGKAVINVETNDFESGLGYTSSGALTFTTATGGAWNGGTTCAQVISADVNPPNASQVGTLTSGQFDGTVCTSLTLDFDIDFYTSAGLSSGIVEYFDGSSWNQIYSISTTGSASPSIALPTLAVNMQLRFTGDMMNKDLDTFSIDNVVVSGEELVTFTWLTIDSPLSGTVIPAGSTTVNMTCLVVVNVLFLT